MSGFSDFLRSISGSDDLFDLAFESQRRTGAAFDGALEAQRAAKRRAELAATPALDKESTILAGEEQLKKMLAAAGMRFSGAPLGDAPLGYTTAYGE